MIYLDNAATSFPKPQIVYESMIQFMKYECANPGRGSHQLARSSFNQVINVRKQLADFFNIKNPMRIAFTKNATEALNIAIQGVIKPGSHVLTTCLEHNSVLRPLHSLAERGILTYSIIGINRDGTLRLSDFNKKIKENTTTIILTSASNITGEIMDIEVVGDFARKNKLVFIVDGSQGAGNTIINVEKMNIDVLCLSAHKSLLGPQGVGSIYIREKIGIAPILIGGTGSNSLSLLQPDFMPDLLESGTLNTPGIVGFGKGIEYINTYGLKNIMKDKKKKIEMLLEGIINIPNIIIYSPTDVNKNSGIVLFNIRDMDSVDVSEILDKKYIIATRGGYHCAPFAHKALGTKKTGAVRLSIGIFTTYEDIEKTILAVKEIASM